MKRCRLQFKLDHARDLIVLVKRDEIFTKRVSHTQTDTDWVCDDGMSRRRFSQSRATGRLRARRAAARTALEIVVG